MRPNPELLSDFNPSEKAIFEFLRPKITDKDTENLASRSYGDISDRVITFKSFRDAENLPWPLEFREVECLWQTSLAKGKNEILLFAVGILIWASSHEGKENSFYFSVGERLPPLIEASVQLGREAEESALSFLHWKLANPTTKDWELPFLALGILRLLVAVNISPDVLVAFLDWIEDEDARTLREEISFVPPPPDVLGLLRGDLAGGWKETVTTIGTSGKGYSKEIQGRLANLSRRMLDLIKS